MRVLVIGGTHFIGLYVVRELSKVGNEVTIFHRGQTESSLLPNNVKHIHGNRDDLEKFSSDFKRFTPDVVLDMGLYNEGQAKKDVSVFKGIVDRIVVPSSMDVYRAYSLLLGIEDGDAQQSPITEEGSLRTKLYPYRETIDNEWAREYDKILVERVILGDKDIAGTVLRLPMVYGPNDFQHRLYYWLKPMQIDKRPAIVLGEKFARSRASRGYVQNVAYAIALAVTSEKSKNRIYNIADEPSLSILQWGDSIAKEVGWRGRIITVPDGNAPAKRRATIEQDWVSDTGCIRSELGFKEIVSFEEGLNKTIEWELDNPSKEIGEEEFDYKTEDYILEKLKIT